MKRFGWLISFWLVAAGGSFACSPGLRAGGEGGADGEDGSGATGTGAKPSRSSGGRDAAGGAGGDDGSESGGAHSNVGGSSSSNTGGDGGGGKKGSGGQSSTGGVIELGPPGKPGHALVAGGTVMRSEKYMLVTTTGESPGGNDQLRSKKYRLVTGIVSASE